MRVYILGIESSCDDTSAAVIHGTKVLSNIIANQHVHEKYGGVVPELASRAHQQHIIPVIDTALKEAKINKNHLHAIAFTRGPGLLGSLLVGSSFAKAMSLSLGIPLIETVVKVKAHNNMEIIGKTIDDAAGEAFDKAAKIMGLPYPGGPMIDKLAKEGNPHAFSFPEPRMPDLDYSFSGLKTSILYFLRDQLKQNPEFIEQNKVDLCASIQSTIISILMKKLELAVKITGIKEVAIAGGVSANSGLRAAMNDASERLGWKVFLPRLSYSTDNAAMIAMAGHFKYLDGDFASQRSAPYARQSSR